MSIPLLRTSSWLLLSLAALTACNRGAHPVLMNKPAPDFTVADGRSRIHLADYRGKVVLLNFWATWCGPCVQEMPSLLELHHSMPDLAILAVSVDEDATSYTNFLARRHIDLTTVRDPRETVPNLYHSNMWPETYVIDRQGMIRRKLVGAQDWTSPEIRNYLKSL